jgi:hypothetical protein
MSHSNTAAAGYSPALQPVAGNHPSVSSSLDGIRRLIDQIASNVADMHGIADRACGQTTASETKGAPQAVPNGMLDEIENALDALLALSNSAVARLARIA